MPPSLSLTVRPMPKINPEIVRWARESAGLATDEAARKLGIQQERLEAIELGDAQPTRRQLEGMAERYRRPLVTFYLQAPPRPASNGQDFRTLPDSDRKGSEALLNALLRDVRARHDLIKSALEEADEAIPLKFVGAARIEDGVPSVVKSMHDALGFSQQKFRAQKSIDDAFTYIRGCAERAGVFVLLIGNLGSHHTNISVKAFRGFAIADPVAPFVVINEKDSRSAWSFTLLHELAHIWLGQTGVSGYDGDGDAEKFCDQVAAKFLLADDELEELDVDAEFRNFVDQIGSFANARNVSRGMVAYNLWRTNRISRNVYFDLVARFEEDRVANLEAKSQQEGGPNYYVVRRHRMGARLLSTVGLLLRSGVLSTTKAGVVLGVKPTAVATTLGDISV